MGRSRLGLWKRAAVLTVLALLTGPASAAAQEALALSDFEGPADLQVWDVNTGTPQLVAEGATHGERALRIAFDPAGPYHPAYMVSFRLPGDWSAYDALVLDVLNPIARPMPAYLLVGDRAWEEKGRTYWNRHNGSITLPPGRTEWVIPVRGLYRGEAGSRNNDIRRNIDPDSVVRVDFGFGARGSSGHVIVDNLRLVRAGRPQRVWAFDFGPPSQSVMLGWTAVSHETSYEPERGFGWGPGGAPWDGADRDSTFGPPLIRDFCEAGGFDFRVDLPPGPYRCVVLYENSGYWGGEQSRHTYRRVLADGRLVAEQRRPDGPAHSLWRFEDIEPVGVDLWDTYMTEVISRAEFTVQVGAGGLLIGHESDHRWGSKVAGLLLAREDDAEALEWADAALGEVEEEFRRMAVCLDEPPADFEARPEWEELGLVAWPVRIEDDVTPNSVPPDQLAPPGELHLDRLAVRGEYEPFCLAVRPLKDLGRCRVELDAPDVEGLAARAQVVRYNTSRGFNTVAYRVRPHTVREAEQVELPADVTREFIVTVPVGEDAPAGRHAFRLRLTDAAGTELLAVPLRLDVRPVTLDRETEFLMGYFGLMPPSLLPPERQAEALERTLVMLREHGMNAVSGGPSWRLEGWRDGRPVVDFGEMDAFFARLRRHGFTRPLNGYGGARFRGLHDRYVKGETGERVERESGLPYPEALLRAWAAVDAHARAHQWPTIFYAMCDETRVRERAERELEFMRMMARVSAAFPRTVRTSGAYSVGFGSRPTDPDDLTYWHQRSFEALDVSSLNRHDDTVMAEAERLGKEVHIYNQGRTRYSFGLYQWSEFRRGVRARWQWHLNILHGYQFFDLDGREPDTAMVCYGRERLYPTIHFERCREGAEDFYLYGTLWKEVERARAEGREAEAARAAAVLEEPVGQVALNQRTPPPGFDADALKARVVAASEELGGGPTP
jgi:hypothetical protein